MKVCLSIILLVYVTIPGISSAGIRDVGNGGDAVVLEFTTLARQALEDINLEAQYLFSEFTAEELQEAIKKTQVISADHTILNGIEKDAINYPSRNLIEVSRSRWRVDNTSIEKLRALVLHEYLGIMKINDSDFSISGKLLDYYSSTKKKINSPEILGRTFLTEQEVGDMTSLIELKLNSQIIFNGIIQGQDFNCEGQYQFDQKTQILKAQLKCGEKSAELEINLWYADIVDFLRNGLVSAIFKFKSENLEYSKSIDAKHFRQY